MDRLGLEGKREWLPAESLLVDQRYQRAISESHLTEIIADFNPNALGILQVSRRPDGDYLLDGQHRREAVVRKKLGHLKLKCEVYEHLSLDEEQELFVLFNEGHLTLNAFHAFQARVKSEDFDAQGVFLRCQRFGLEIVPPGVNLKPNQVSALSYLEELEEQQLLASVFAVIKQGWGDVPYKKIYLRVMASVLKDHTPWEVIPILKELPPTELDREAARRQDTPGLQLRSYREVLRSRLG